MNILRNYCKQIQGFTLPVFKSILNNSNDRFILEDRARIYTIKDTEKSKVSILQCIECCYTNKDNNKPIKIPKTNAKCYNIQKEFGILNITPSNCQACHQAMLKKYEENLVKILKK